MLLHLNHCVQRHTDNNKKSRTAEEERHVECIKDKEKQPPKGKRALTPGSKKFKKYVRVQIAAAEEAEKKK